MNALDGKLFTWNGKHGYACDSDLPTGYVRRLHKDSLDEGFTIVSHRTGTRKTFAFSRPVRRNGDVMSNVFVSPDGFTVEIFND